MPTQSLSKSINSSLQQVNKLISNDLDYVSRQFNRILDGTVKNKESKQHSHPHYQVYTPNLRPAAPITPIGNSNGNLTQDETDDQLNSKLLEEDFYNIELSTEKKHNEPSNQSPTAKSAVLKLANQPKPAAPRPPKPHEQIHTPPDDKTTRNAMQFIYGFVFSNMTFVLATMVLYHMLSLPLTLFTAALIAPVVGIMFGKLLTDHTFAKINNVSKNKVDVTENVEANSETNTIALVIPTNAHKQAQELNDEYRTGNNGSYLDIKNDLTQSRCGENGKYVALGDGEINGSDTRLEDDSNYDTLPTPDPIANNSSSFFTTITNFLLAGSKKNEMVFEQNQQHTTTSTTNSNTNTVTSRKTP